MPPMMAASPTAVTSQQPKTDGGNVLAALLAAAASMHRQQQQQQNQQQQQQPQTPKANAVETTKVHQSLSKPATPANSTTSGSGCCGASRNKSSSTRNVTTKAILDNNEKKKVTTKNPTIQEELEAKRDKLCQLLNLKPALLIETQPSASRSTSDAFPELETWHDEDEVPIDDSCYQELVDPSNSNGWSAEDMFKYNEKRHKITSSYNTNTLADNYTTPLPKSNSKKTMRLATQLAKEIEDRVLAEGRVTPESSDDDELFEKERLRRAQLKQKRQLDQLQNHSQTSHQNLSYQHQQQQQQHQQKMSMMNNVNSIKTTYTHSSSQYSNSTETPVTVSLSSSPTLNDTVIIKPVTSSSRNILRTCLT